MKGSILRCDTCGGLVKRVRDFDQEPCRCVKPKIEGRPGRMPRVELGSEDVAVDDAEVELIRSKL